MGKRGLGLAAVFLAATIAAVLVFVLVTGGSPSTDEGSGGEASGGEVEPAEEALLDTPRLDRGVADAIRAGFLRRAKDFEGSTADMGSGPAPIDDELWQGVMSEIGHSALPLIRKDCVRLGSTRGMARFDLSFVEDEEVGLVVAGVDAVEATVEQARVDCVEDRLFGFVFTPIEGVTEFQHQLAIVF